MTPVAPQILETTQNLPKEALQLEREIGISAGGQTSYDSPLAFEANVVPYDTARRARGSEFVVTRDGSEHRVAITLYVQGDETNVPNTGDRVTWGGRRYIAIEKKVASGLEYTSTAPDHTRVGCRNA
jgi:hypothetical protein